MVYNVVYYYNLIDDLDIYEFLFAAKINNELLL